MVKTRNYKRTRKTQPGLNDSKRQKELFFLAENIKTEQVNTIG